MKVAADTNVLVRFLTWDDTGQAAKAARVIEEANAVFISTVVLCEVVRVLKRAYRYKAEAGLRLLEAGGDFADGVKQGRPRPLGWSRSTGRWWIGLERMP